MGQKSVQLKDKDGNLLMPTTDSAIVAHDEGTVKEAIDAIGIYEFQGISYDGSTTGFVNNGDIIFDMTQGKFIIKSGTFTNEANYNNGSVARSDVLFRCVPASDMAGINGTYGLYHYVSGSGNIFPRLVDEADMANATVNWNLARDGNFTAGRWSGGGKESTSFDEVYGNIISFTSTNNLNIPFAKSGGLEEKQTYTVSFYGCGGLAGAILRDSDTKTTYYTFASDIPNDNTMRRYEITFTTGTSGSGAVDLQFYDINDTLKLALFKIERGSEATEWRPCLLDV